MENGQFFTDEPLLIGLVERTNTDLNIATAGIQRTEARMSTAMSTMAQTGHSCLSVTPLLATQAGYPLPSRTISKNDATRILSMANGLRYFQHMSQYKPGRLPVINSISSANLNAKFFDPLFFYFLFFKYESFSL